MFSRFPPDAPSTTCAQTKKGNVSLFNLSEKKPPFGIEYLALKNEPILEILLSLAKTWQHFVKIDKKQMTRSLPFSSRMPLMFGLGPSTGSAIQARMLSGKDF